MTQLEQRRCAPLEEGSPALSEAQQHDFLQELDNTWVLADGKKIERTFHFENFAEALHFTNTVGAIAEEQDHHPDIFLSWGKVKVCLWTHTVNGLSENDFIVAAKCNQAYT